MDLAAEAVDVTKRFPETSGYRNILTFWRRRYVTALNRVNLWLPKGRVLGLLGPNGAGKTTLMKIFAGLVLPDEGRAVINGIDLSERPGRARSRVTYVSGEDRSLYWRLTGKQNLRFFAVLNEVPRKQVGKRVAEVLSTVGLSEAADVRVGKYSTGMRQRLCIARGLLAESELLLLDEPTRSLDPSSARNLWGFIREDLVGRRGQTIVIATHNSEEASRLCDLVAVMHQGQVKFCDTVAALSSKVAGQVNYSITLTNASHEAIGRLSNLKGVYRVVMPPNCHGNVSLEVAVSEAEAQIPLVLNYLMGAGANVLEVKQVSASLGEAISALTEESH